MFFLRLSTPFVALALLAACDRTDRDRSTTRDPGTTTVTGGNPVTGNNPGTTTVTGASLSKDSALSRIIAARCDREATCNNVGADKRYASQDVCAQKLRADLGEALNANECARGIDQKELDECLAEIKTENCNNPIDKLERLAACRTSDLCLKTGAPNR